jgi:hypothetical protein
MSHTENIYVAIVDDTESICRSFSRLLPTANSLPVACAPAIPGRIGEPHGGNVPQIRMVGLHASRQRFILVGMRGLVCHTLAVCRLDKLFVFCDSEDEARNRLRPPA